MKPVRYTILALLLCPALSAHGADNVPDAARTVSERVVEPSPDVATARRYADLPVSYATGSASVSLPLMTLSTPTLSVSLGLDYRCEAKKVDEPAGWVGLGWTLTGLGSVSRQICGMPDDKRADFFDFKAYSSDPHYYNDLIELDIDANYDRYTLVTPDGESVQFIIDNGDVRLLGFSEIKIDRKSPGGNPLSTDVFVVTTPRGFRYEYSEKEWVEYDYPPTPKSYYKAVTAWHLTKITAPGNNSSATIEYARGTGWAKHVANKLYTLGYHWPGGESGSGDGEYHLGGDYLDGPLPLNARGNTQPTAHTTYLSPPIPKKIACSTGTIEFEFESDGFDNTMENGVVERLKRIRLADPSGVTVRTAEFSTYTSPSGRRMLGKVAISGDRGEIEAHRFEYNPEYNCAGDIFGYPNDKTTDPCPASILDEDLTIRGSRSISPRRLAGGLLACMTSSSGTSTEFEYEPSVARLGGRTYFWGTEIAVGTRIKSITVTDGGTERSRTRQFKYHGDTLNMDIRVFGVPSFLAPSGTCSRSSSSKDKYCNFNMSVVFTSSSRQAGMPFEAMKVYYDTVEETVSGTGMDRPVTTRYEYDLRHCILGQSPCGSAVVNDYEAPETAIYNPGLTAKGDFKSVNERERYQPIFRSHLQTVIFRENIGGTPLLKKKTVYDGVDNSPRYTEEYEYSVRSKAEVPVGLYYETAIYRINGPSMRYDIDNVGHVSNGPVLVDLCNARCTDIRRLVHYKGGKSREISEHYRYIRHKSPADSASERKGRYLHPGFYGDSTVADTAIMRDVPLSVSYCHGGDTITRYDLYSGDIDRDFFNKLPDRYLPVAQKWVAAEGGRRDSLETAWLYGNFHGMTRAVRETVSRHGAVLDMAAYTAYDALGLPTAMTRRDGSEYAMTWDAYGNLTSRELVGPGLESRYTYRPLVGCTSVTYPSGRRKYFSYDNGRLSQVRNTANEPVASYGYTMANPGLNWGAQGENAVTYTAYTASGEAVSRAVYDGFGMKTADIVTLDGTDVVTATEYDALDRAVKLWQPAPVDTAAAAGFYGDTRPWTDYVYDTDGSQNIVSSTPPGKDMLGHAATNEYLCNTQSGELRCRRLVLEGDRLVDKGAYADAALDVVRATDADGHRVLTFTDWRGRTVLVRKVLGDNK